MRWVKNLCKRRQKKQQVSSVPRPRTHIFVLALLANPSGSTHLLQNPTRFQTSTPETMEEDGIALVLARASELRSKITNCIHNSSSLQNGSKTEHKDPSIPSERLDGGVADEDEDEAESLLNIRDALESLEAQLNSLQALQQQQWYEKEAALAEIDYSRKKLLTKLREYKGDDLEVIREATAFASETVEENNDLLLPPYPSRPSRNIPSDNRYLSHFPSTQKLSQNGAVNHVHELKEEGVHGSESKSSLKVVRLFASSAAKTVLTVVGFIAVLSLAGFEPKVVRKRNNELKILEPFQQQTDEEKSAPTFECPPGKILVVENGETRCLVKERVEIPFESVVATPDVNYGCG